MVFGGLAEVLESCCPLIISPPQAGKALKAAEPARRERRAPWVSAGLGSQFQSWDCPCLAAKLRTSLLSDSPLLRKSKALSIFCRLYFGFRGYKTWTMLLLKERGPPQALENFPVLSEWDHFSRSERERDPLPWLFWHPPMYLAYCYSGRECNTQPEKPSNNAPKSQGKEFCVLSTLVD